MRPIGIGVLLVGGVLLWCTAMGVDPVAAGGSPAPVTAVKTTVTGFAASHITLYNNGGSLTLSASVSHATACTFRSNKPLPGLPAAVLCTSGLASYAVRLPANPGKRPVTYTFKLTVTGATTANATPAVKVTVGSSPPPASPPVAALSVGEAHACVLLVSGTVRCWGGNSAGELGDGTTTSSAHPVTVIGLGGVGDLSGVTAISAGVAHECALLAGGSVACWGLNDGGQLGDGTTMDRGTPVLVSGLTGVTSLSAGYRFTCAVLADTTARCWGDDSRTQLGDGNSTHSAYPVPVSGLSGARSITAGGEDACTVLLVGTVLCWGANGQGEAGNGTRDPAPVPVPVGAPGGNGVLSGVLSLTAGTYHFCARLSGGTVACWGSNGAGQLGTGVFTDSAWPVVVASLTATTVVAGGDHTCATMTSGSAQCWGDNWVGALGNGTKTNSATPVTVQGEGGIGTLAGAISVAAGYDSTCALLTGNVVKCWGYNYDGQLGDGTVLLATDPVTVVGI